MRSKLNTKKLQKYVNKTYEQVFESVLKKFPCFDLSNNEASFS